MTVLWLQKLSHKSCRFLPGGLRGRRLAGGGGVGLHCCLLLVLGELGRGPWGEGLSLPPTASVGTYE